MFRESTYDLLNKIYILENNLELAIKITERIVIRAIKKYASEHPNEIISNWAKNWLSNSDRTKRSAQKAMNAAMRNKSIGAFYAAKAARTFATSKSRESYAIGAVRDIEDGEAALAINAERERQRADGRAVMEAER